MKFLVLGDTHGNTGAATRALATATEHIADAIVQVGDFGYWEHLPQGKRFLDDVSDLALAVDIPVFWIDGNHENHTWLRNLYGPGGERHKPTSEGFWEIRPHLYYIPRGTKWVWDGVTMMGVGGAYSIDKPWREPGKSWWPEETIAPEELEFVKAQGTADILFTHDCPTNAPFKFRIKDDLDSQIHRQTMNEIGKSVQPFYWFHGHMHEFYYYEFDHQRGSARVVGLECDDMNQNWCIVDTETLDRLPVS